MASLRKKLRRRLHEERQYAKEIEVELTFLRTIREGGFDVDFTEYDLVHFDLDDVADAMSEVLGMKVDEDDVLYLGEIGHDLELKEILAQAEQVALSVGLEEEYMREFEAQEFLEYVESDTADFIDRGFVVYSVKLKDDEPVAVVKVRLNERKMGEIDEYLMDEYGLDADEVDDSVRREFLEDIAYDIGDSIEYWDRKMLERFADERNIMYYASKRVLRKVIRDLTKEFAKRNLRDLKKLLSRKEEF